MYVCVYVFILFHTRLEWIYTLIAWLFTQNRRGIWNLSDFSGTQTHIYLVCKWTIKHLAKLAVIF